jgi:uncharacterized protein (DUF2252 family)
MEKAPMSKRSEKPIRLADRQPLLMERQRLKMATSAHAFVRGSTVKFYEWLESAGGRKIPRGPAVWICGDCHAGNLGPVSDSLGNVEIEIRDVDQTVIGNPAHDLIRLGLSLAVAARGSDLPGVTTARMIEEMVGGYALAFKRGAQHAVPRPESVRVVMRKAHKRTWKHLAKERLEDVKPRIPLGKKFWPLSNAEKQELQRLFTSSEVRTLVTSLHGREPGSPMALLDAAYWMKGCSSLGRLRFAVLLHVRNGLPGSGEFCLIDIKEAAQAAAPRYVDSPMPRDNGERIVKGARHLSPFLGGRMLPARFLDRAVFLRELLPQDLKLEIDQLTQDEAVQAASYLSHVVGKAHSRQMDAATRRKWLKELDRNHSKVLDAPSWLWSSVVELMAAHEAAYLDHCRKYARATECLMSNEPRRSTRSASSGLSHSSSH